MEEIAKNKKIKKNLILINNILNNLNNFNIFNKRSKLLFFIMIKNENEIVTDPFKVYVRVRPFLEREIAPEGEGKVNPNKNAVVVEDHLVNI
jgi:hypothetical protein